MNKKIASMLFRLSDAIERFAHSLADEREEQPVIDDSEVYS